MRKTFKFRLLPTKAQETAMQNILNQCRGLYDNLLEKRKTAWEERQESLTFFGKKKTLPQSRA